MRLTIHQRREPKKAPKSYEVVPQANVRKNPTFPVHVPPSLTQLQRKGKKMWSQHQVLEIIKLNAFLQDQEIDCRASTFVRLWSSQEGKCAVTGVPLNGFVDKDEYRFDVGIDCVSGHGKWSGSNVRLVMLPIATARAREKWYKVRVADIDEVWLVKRPFARLILLWIKDALFAMKELYRLPAEIKFGVPESVKNRFNPADLEVMVHLPALVPSQLKYDKTRGGQAIRLTIDDEKHMVVVEQSSMKKTSIPLSDPSIDIPKVVCDLCSESMKTQLIVMAKSRLQEWYY